MTKDWLTDEAASFAILFVAELMPVEVHEAWALLPSSRSVVATQVAAQ